MIRTRTKHVPQRRCLICGEQRPKPELVRVARLPGGGLEIDAGPKVPGRGAYLCRRGECLSRAADGKRIAKALKLSLSAGELAALQELADTVRPMESGAGC